MTDITVRAQKSLYEDWSKCNKKHLLTNETRAKRVVEAIPKDTDTILDIGAGDGLISNVLRKSGYEPVALDISYHGLKSIGKGKLVQGTANDLPFSSNSFDCIVAGEVLEHLPEDLYDLALKEISRVSKKYVVITVPYREKLEVNHARCQVCGCIFNGAYHLRSFEKSDLENLMSAFRCTTIRAIVEVLDPDRTLAFELFFRQHIAREYLYFGPHVKCPLCRSKVDEKPKRNAWGWFAAAMRYIYRLIYQDTIPLWYLAVFEKSE
jgi:ubiquinone/menaquinone biosynthesis C-methylase UbiE